MEDREIREAQQAVELETRCNIDTEAATEEALWYSILNVMSLNLGSGMGIPMEQPEVLEALGNVGLCPAELPIRNPRMLKAVFKSGDPSLAKQFDQRDFDTWRWSPDSFDQMLVPQAQGWSVIAQCECAKWFCLPERTETIPMNFRKEWMINGLQLYAAARKQCDFAFDNLRNEQGLFPIAAEPGSVKVTEPATNLEDQACMLWACSNLASMTGQTGSLLFADEYARQRYMNLADDLFQAISNNNASLIRASANKTQACSTAIPALAWYASIANNQELKSDSLRLLRELGDLLVKAQDANEMVGDTLVDAAAAMRALIEAYRVTHLRTYAESAMRIFNFIESQWWKLPGVYSQSPLSSEYTYNCDDVAVITGALNAGRLFMGDRVNRGLSELRMRVFFCNAVNLSGLQMSMPSMDFLPEWLREREASTHFRHEAIPFPSQVGGELGVAPVFAGEVGYDPQTDTWSRRMLFDAPAAMHACCEFLWLNYEAINGFPDLHLEHAPAEVRQAAGIEVGA